jgi:hypothetical protein
MIFFHMENGSVFSDSPEGIPEESFPMEGDGPNLPKINGNSIIGTLTSDFSLIGNYNSDMKQRQTVTPRIVGTACVPQNLWNSWGLGG